MCNYNNSRKMKKVFLTFGVPKTFLGFVFERVFKFTMRLNGF